MQSDKHPKPRIDLRGPEYPHAPYICMAVPAVQAFLADHWSPESLFALSVLTLFVAMAAHHRAVTRTGRTELTAPAFIGLTAGYGGGLHFVFLHGFVPDGTLLWIAAGLAALYPQVRRVRKRHEERLKGTARAPKFLDKSREERVRFVELLARVATAFACADGAFTEAKRAAIKKRYGSSCTAGCSGPCARGAAPDGLRPRRSGFGAPGLGGFGLSARVGPGSGVARQGASGPGRRGRAGHPFRPPGVLITSEHPIFAQSYCL